MLFLVLIPVITFFIGLFMYKFQGKSIELFRLDVIQFVYMFIMAPTLFVWMKTFLFYLLRNELEYSLSITEIFVIDTAFSVVAIFVMAAIAIHSLTKTFWIKRHHNPHFDLYSLSEYFHLWWSHIAIWGGAMLLISFVAMVNVFIPLELVLTKPVFLLTQLFAILSGGLFFFAVWMSDPQTGNFMRVMKLIMMGVAFAHIITYFVFDPGYNPSYIAFWFSITMFTTSTFLGSFIERYEKASWFRSLFLHVGWGNNKNIDIFAKKKKK